MLPPRILLPIVRPFYRAFYAFSPPSKSRGWQAFLAIYPRRIDGDSSGWLVYLYRKRENGRWVYRYY